MNKRLALSLCAAILAGACLVHAYDPKAPKDAYTARDEADILQLEAEWAKALQTRDTAVMERLLAPEYVGVDPAGVAMSKAQEIAMFQRGDLKFESIATGGQKVKVYIGGVIVTGTSSVKGKFKDQDISGEYRFIDIFERKPSGWQVVYSQLTKVETEKDKKQQENSKPAETPGAAR
ncbi:MAG TPA: nuclear transport factor 2 family protein [Verrucomicrobiae bacterium]|nr:nuclear transport factor 2 family protein [Verrucomicrobiae bacterium]